MAVPKPSGFKLSLGALKSKPGLTKSLSSHLPTRETKRARLTLDNDDPPSPSASQEISGWDTAGGGAVDVAGKTERDREEEPRVIPALPNRDWQEEARRKVLAGAPHVRAAEALAKSKDGERGEGEGEKKLEFGLTIVKKKVEVELDGEIEREAERMDIDANDETDGENLTDEQQLEKKALDALINGKTADQELIIPVQTSGDEASRAPEANVPDVPSLDTYTTIPVDGFGAALLRGMGWKDGESIGRSGAPEAAPKAVKRRPALLGIGAKEDAAMGVELGAWGKDDKGRGKREVKGTRAAMGYNPVALKNKVTGEIVTEEELKAKMEAQDLVEEEEGWREGRGRDERRREGGAEYHGRRREKVRDRELDHDPRDGHHDRGYDSERRRDKRRERDDRYKSDRRRDDKYDSDRRRDDRKSRDGHRRDRSRSPDSRRDRDRDRDRDRRERSRDDAERRKNRERERWYDKHDKHDKYDRRERKRRDERY